jgi:hypothetical protein
VSKDAIRRASEAGQEMLKTLSGQMLEQWRARQFFPSTDASDRGAVSPLGGLAKAEEKTEPTKTTKPKTKFVW